LRSRSPRLERLMFCLSCTMCGSRMEISIHNNLANIGHIACWPS
jgi:hypothetical protein